MWRRNLVYLEKTLTGYSASIPINARAKCPWKMTTASHYHCLKKNHNITSTPNLQSLHDVKVAENKEADCNTFTYRTHNCGELRPKHSGQKVTLCGWVQFQRLTKFLLLRDAYGVIQCIVNNNQDLPDIPLETIVKVEGTVVLRPKSMINTKMATGEVEVVIEDLKILNNVDKLPFNLRDYQKPKEQLRLQYRYVDLRFPEMQNILRFRSSMLHNMRRFLLETHGFVEVETPTLFCRTPGGAREFVVPTHHKNLFYSLVQSPQQFKQMLMAGGIDRYFQVARCYRDETTRPDRQPEFTQLDIELSFTNLDGVLSLIENLLYETYLQGLPKPPFKRITYKDALQNYGTDKPNLTYDLTFKKITHLFDEKSNNFGAYALPYHSELGKLTSKYKDIIRKIAIKYRNKVIFNENLNKALSSDLSQKIHQETGPSNSCIISMGDDEDSCLCLGEIRVLIASLLESKNLLVIDKGMKPLWVVDFPLFIEGENGLETCHHPFTAPHPDDIHLLKTEPYKVRSLAYDLVINGNEVGGGSVRVHNAGLQEELLKILNIDSEKLSHFIDALKSGCPPHAGIALGIDRLVSIACNTESIRDVIAFPKSHDGRDPLSGAPNTISDDDKKYYNILTVK
ncbi:aspartate--tRNA ligase, mitochondrial [Plodia interpunctella]|uniref:aspartate--tRNA ligase, mitochondrial n=1 Tax=Plodia interpunctella TaxID=58824 RepID=UPI002367D600|nr:aspartate--tRNA ligase, mitochondrial [Plodia interpunctella]